MSYIPFMNQRLFLCKHSHYLLPVNSMGQDVLLAWIQSPSNIITMSVFCKFKPKTTGNARVLRTTMKSCVTFDDDVHEKTIFFGFSIFFLLLIFWFYHRSKCLLNILSIQSEYTSGSWLNPVWEVRTQQGIG